MVGMVELNPAVDTPSSANGGEMLDTLMVIDIFSR